MRIVSEEWREIVRDYCEHYEVSKEHFGELRRLKNDAPEHIKKITPIN